MGYALSWNGIVTAQDDPYDARGMISEVIQTGDRIHLQDARIIFGGKNDTVNSIKQSIMKYVFENNIDYHMNYQTDLTGLAGFDDNYTQYSNEFTSKYNESIGAVGTYFNDSGIDYSFDVYVNGVKVHTQSGASEFAGFKTIVLDKYVPIKTGDKFKVVFKNNNIPYQAFSRQHYAPGVSFISKDGQSWKDMSIEDKTVCLKVYTL